MMKLIQAAALAAATLSLAPAAAFAPPPAAAPAFAPTRFSVVVEGSGPDVILIPGLSSPREVWDGARAALGGKYRLHLVQLNGFGGTAPGANAQGEILAGAVAELKRYIEANRLQRPAVVGHSMGGLMGLMLAKAAPDSIGRLMVVDALPFVGTLFDPSATVEAIAPRAAAMRDMMAAPASPEQRAAAATGTAAQLSNSETGRALVARWVAASDAKVSAQAMYEDLVTDLRPAIPSIRTPITLVYAWDAAAIPEAQAKALFEGAYVGAPAIAFAPIGGSRHFVMLDQPERFAAALKEFLARK
jgi:pimeloyl-ACP methyl ester carboxylesterase